jgi:hypothetical protein
MFSNRVPGFSTVTRRRTLPFLVAIFTSLLPISQAPTGAQGGDWPRNDAPFTFDIYKAAGEEPEDPTWLHLMSAGSTVSLAVRLTQLDSTMLPLEGAGVQIRYTVHGVPVSDWLSAPFTFTLSIDNPALDALMDGVHDISLDVAGAARSIFKPRPVYLHLARGRAVSPLVPVISRDCQYCAYGFDFGPGVVYVDYRQANRRGRPVDPNVVPWHGAPEAEDLYQEEMAPHTDLFQATQMWWEQASGPHAGSRFARGLVPKWDEDHRVLRVTWGHERFPFRDGPRGVAWTSTYITGQIDSTGGFAFAEAGGPVRYMRPDGEVITVAGWRVRPGRDPIWIGKPTSVVRQNMELRGTWVNGQYPDNSGFRTPLDVAIDPANEHIWYVAGYEDQCIWKIEMVGGSYENARVSVLAGSPEHQSGFADGTGAGARFNGPASLVFDPIADVLYVADQDNDAIRRITRTGIVTTVFGSPGMESRLNARGVHYDTYGQYAIQQANRDHSQYTVTAAQASTGLRPDIYMPQAIRVDSFGNLVLLELGYGGIRRLSPATGETTPLGNVWQRFEPNSRGWAWLDVDRWGNSGPLNSIYWCGFQMSTLDGEIGNHTNEAYGWLPASGGSSRWLFPSDWDPNPDGWGPRNNTDPPHYGWLVAVDPRGAVLLAGGGEHGVTRLRKRRAADPIPPDFFDYQRGKELWRSGGLDVGPSFALKFGSEAHSHLGYADATDYRFATDADIINAFEIPLAVQSNPAKLHTLINFIRLNGGEQVTVAGGYVPPPPSASAPPAVPVTSSPSPPSSAGCATPDPFASMGGGTCWNGGWLPPGMTVPGSSPPPSVPTSPSAPSTPPTAPGGSGGCATSDPFAAMGGGTCWNGGWLPPGMTPPAAAAPPLLPSSPAPMPPDMPSGPPQAVSHTCATPDPFGSMGGGTCWNGGWLPPGMVPPSGGASPLPAPQQPTQPSAPGVCITPDPFTAMGGGRCVNGGWIPRTMGG